MARHLSKPAMVMLDVARGGAAVYVVLHHVAQARGAVGGAGVLLRFGQEAVIIFFLISGFVIFVNEYERASDLRSYFLRRIRRIYPTLLVALCLSIVLSILDPTFSGAFSWTSLFGTILGLQDVSALKPGVIVDSFMGNTPLWSLSYEVAFYLAFPLVLSAWKRHPQQTTHLIGAVSLVSFVAYTLWPNHLLLVAAYFLIWWCGAMAGAAYLEGRRTIWAMRASLGWLCGLVAASAVAVSLVGFAGLGVYPFLMFRHFFISLAAIVVAFGPIGRIICNACGALAIPASFVSSISFGIYVFHYPLLVQSGFSESFVSFIFAIGTLFVIAYLADRRLNLSLPKVR